MKYYIKYYTQYIGFTLLSLCALSAVSATDKKEEIQKSQLGAKVVQIHKSKKKDDDNDNKAEKNNEKEAQSEANNEKKAKKDSFFKKIVQSKPFIVGLSIACSMLGSRIPGGRILIRFAFLLFRATPALAAPEEDPKEAKKT